MQSEPQENIDLNYVRQLEKSIEILQNEIDTLRNKKRSVSSRASSAKRSGNVSGALPPNALKAFAEAKSFDEILLAYIEYIIKDVFAIENGIYIYDKTGKLTATTENELAKYLPEFVKHCDENAIFEWIVAQRHAEIIPNFLPGKPEIAFLIVPFFIRDKVQGFAVSCCDKTKTNIDRPKLDSVTEFAYLPALAIENIIFSNELSGLSKKKNEVVPGKPKPQNEHIVGAIADEIANMTKVLDANIFMLESGIGDIKQRVGIIKQQTQAIKNINIKLNEILNPEKTSSFPTLQDVINDVTLFTNTQLQNCGIISKIILEENAMRINADKVRLVSAILDVVLFAKSKMKDGGELQITLVETRAEKANLIITDNSIGLSGTELEQIFEHRGLGESRQIIDEAGGKFEVLSELGKGITYKIVLPIIN